jgi:hypothetical protein
MLELFRLPGAAPYAEYHAITDADRGISVTAPVDWLETATDTWLTGPRDSPQAIGDIVLATPNEQALYTGYRTPGIFFAGSGSFIGLSGDEIFAESDRAGYQSCDWAGSDDFANQTYIGGRYSIYWNCDGEDVVILEIGAPARDASHGAYLLAYLTSTADIEAVVRAIDSFAYEPSGEPSPPTAP